MNIGHLILILCFLVSPACVTAATSTSDIFARKGNWRIYGDAPTFLEGGVGIFDWDEASSPAAKLELRFGRKFHFVAPAIGILANTDGGWFAYGGLYTDVAYGNLLITPFWGAGGLEQGNGSDLGGTFQFRSSLTLAWHLENGRRIGLQVAHISNSGIHDKNPGEQDLLLTFARPF